MEWLIWLSALAMVFGCVWLSALICRPKRPKPTVKALPAPKPLTRPSVSYIPRWELHRKRSVAADKGPVGDGLRPAPPGIAPRQPNQSPASAGLFSCPKESVKATIYTLPSCVQCNQTKKLMDREGVAYDVVKVEEHPHIAADFKEQGLLQAHIVVVGNDGGPGRASS